MAGIRTEEGPAEIIQMFPLVGLGGSIGWQYRLFQLDVTYRVALNNVLYDEPDVKFLGARVVLPLSWLEGL